MKDSEAKMIEYMGGAGTVKRNLWMRALALLLVFAITGCGAAKESSSQELSLQAESVASSEISGVYI